MSTRAETADFVHLHTHSHYSLLEALPKIPELVGAAKADGQEALALTDNGNLYAAIDFYKECKEQGIKPIIGVDFFVAPRTRHDKEHRVDDRHSRLVLLAKDPAGYKSLIQLVSLAHLEGFYYRPRIDHELLQTYKGGLIAILPAYSGEHARAMKDGAKDKAKQTCAWYRGIFGSDCFAEITRHPEIEGHDAAMKSILELVRVAGIAPVAAHECYYLKKDDALARELVNNIRTGRTLNREFEENAHDFSFITKARAQKLFADIPEALENSKKIADACNVELELGRWVFPDFPIPPHSSHDTELRALAYAGFTERGIAQTSALVERVDYELSVIASKGYSPYFLVVADLLRHARDVGIYTNTRGSAAGSLVSFLCGITTVNPIEYQLPFERFLNPERPSAPDIDMDLADNRRDELIDYVRNKYGEDHVAQIGTFGTMLARAAVRDVARALGHSYGTGDRIAKMIPFGKQGFPVTIDSSLGSIPELKEAYKKDADAREIIDLAKRVEGNARHVGVHAAGVVIAPGKVTDFVPVQLDPKGGKTITQYDMYAVEDAGLLKFDFLGLTNLSVLADSVQRVKERFGTLLNLDRIPLDDPATYSMLSRGETLGVFQLAGGGMTNYLMELKPSTIHDINAMVALYRPGPMAFIPAYIERKHNPTLVKYLDPRMEPILKNGYGVIVYQDDVLEIAIKLAGYTWLEADKLRKAMGKKIPKEMAAQKETLTKGAIKNGMSPTAAQKLWEQIETFAAYGFGRAHAASYGNLAYKTAYMKANYPVDYMAAVLTADAGDVEKIAEVVVECSRMGLAVQPPSVNESRGTFTVTDHSTIRFGLYSIKNFGTGVSDSIISEREKNGRYVSIGDFLIRITDRNLNKKSLESLIMSGALDEFGERNTLLGNIDMLLLYHRESLSAPVDQGSLFGAESATISRELPLVSKEAASIEEKLAWEKELLGFYVSGHPLDKHKEKLARQKMNLKEAREKMPHGVETVIAGFFETVQSILTKNGEKMVFAKLADFSGGVEIVAFPRTLQENSSLFTPGSCVMLKGKFSNRNGETSFVVDRAKAL
ncbi:MAG: DNA polymerase III subunit alpha [Parcubacteria group bacterium Gr01-1014_8]|nr:MAG: DNA polymerase III subunit alpha [Parcubacteria group bacterium Gr01-1014_8]